MLLTGATVELGMELDFGEVVDALPGLIWITRDDGRCDYVNRGWCDYTGLDLAAAKGRGWQDAAHAEDRATLLETWAEIRRTGVHKEIYIRLRRADGEYRWFTLSPARYGDRRKGRWCWLGMNADEGPVTDGRLRRLFDMLPMQAAFLNLEGTSEFSNRQTLDDYDMTLEQLAAWQTSGAIHADDFPIVREQLDRLLTTGQMFDAIIRMRFRDGTYRWTRSRCVPCRDAQGNVVRYVTVQTDVHELKHAEDLLAAEVKLLEMVARGEPQAQVLEALSRSLEELCPGCRCGVILIDPDRMRFRLETGSGLPGNFAGLADGISVHGGDTPYSLAVIEKAPIVTADLANDPRWEGSAWLPAMKSAGFGSCYATPIISVSGAISGVVAIYRAASATPTSQEEHLIDRFAKIAGITIENAQLDSGLRLQVELLQRLPVSAWTLKPDGTPDFVNQVWLELAGQPLDFVRSNPEAWMTAIHPEDREAAARSFWDGVHSGRDFALEYRSLRARDGTYRWLLSRAVALRDSEGQILRFVGTSTDIDDQKRADERLREARAELAHVARVATLNAMTASIAHEVSQPLAGILTNASTCLRMLAADPPNPAGAAVTVQRAIRDANRAADVIKRLRAMFSANPPAVESANLNDLTREVITLSAAELRRSGALLQTDFAANLPPVHVDRVQLQQVILNLLLNAADAVGTVEDRPRTILVRSSFMDNASVRLDVRDSGIGIEPETAEKLFGAFYTTKTKGMGVGLSISRSIVEMHDGRLWAEANDGPGATFSFVIPSDAADNR